MFQYFGFKDAVMVIWKNKIKILSIVFILSILSTAFFSLLPMPQKSADLGGGVKQSDEETIVLEKRGINFYIEYIGNDSELSGKVITDILIESLETDECKRYIYNYALQHMSSEEIVTRLHSEFSEASISVDFFPQYLVYTRDESGIGVSMWTRSYDGIFSEMVLNAYLEWINNILEMQSSNAEMVITYELNSQIVVPPTQSVSLSEKYSLDWKKVFAISFIIFGCFLIIIFMGIALFKPVLNRKSDYENIGLHVIGEMNGKWRNYERKKDL